MKSQTLDHFAELVPWPRLKVGRYLLPDPFCCGLCGEISAPGGYVCTRHVAKIKRRSAELRAETAEERNERRRRDDAMRHGRQDGEQHKARLPRIPPAPEGLERR
jgi:hypothetical protein